MEFKESSFENLDEEKEENKKLEKRESEVIEIECGENVHEIITCMRHGPKEGPGNAPLAKDAEKAILKSVGGFSLTRDGIKILTSEAKPERCQETGEIISKLLKDYKRIHREVRPLTNPFSFYPEDREALIEIQRSFYPENYESLSPEEKEKIDLELEKKIVLEFLKDQRFENSRVDAAARFAEWIKLLINASKWLPSKMEINLVNVSHGFNLMAFLKEAMIFEDGTRAKDLEAKEFLEKIGGSIEPAEFFEIDVNRQDKENLETSLKFKGEDYNLDFSRIEELAKLAKQIRDDKTTF